MDPHLPRGCSVDRHEGQHVPRVSGSTVLSCRLEWGRLSHGRVHLMPPAHVPVGGRQGLTLRSLMDGLFHRRVHLLHSNSMSLSTLRANILNLPDTQRDSQTHSTIAATLILLGADLLLFWTGLWGGRKLHPKDMFGMGG